MHKKIYFRAGWAKYENAVKGKLKLTPKDNVKNLLKNDYDRMQDMFYGQTVDWDEIMTEIEVYQQGFNGRF